MVGKVRISRGISKFLTAALFAGGLFLSQSCSAGFWSGKKTELREKTKSLNKLLKKFDRAVATHQNRAIQMQAGGSSAAAISSILYLLITDDPSTEIEKELEKEADNYLDYCAKYPKTVVKVKQKMHLIENCDARWRVKKIIRSKFESALKKCMVRHSKKDCNEAFSHIAKRFLPNCCITKLLGEQVIKGNHNE